MTTATAFDCIAIESDFVAADGLLGSIIGRVQQLDVPYRLDVLADLVGIRSQLVRVLGRLEGPITEAGALHEQWLGAVEAAPF